MPNSSLVGWLVLAGLSALAGNRTASAPTALSRYLASTFAGRALPVPAAYFNDPLVADGLTILAAGELGADKLPFVPNRTDLMPLLSRGLSGGITGAAVSAIQGSNRMLGALIGFVVAVANAITFFRLRRLLVQKKYLPDLAVALLEDVFVISMAIWLLRHLPRH